MRLQCLRHNKPITYQSGPFEILTVACAMHDRMVSLNDEKETVLQACRAGGWFAYRPGPDGNPTRCSEQDWAKPHSDCAGRLPQSLLDTRYTWLDDAGKPTLSFSELPAWHKDGKVVPDKPAEADLQLDDLDCAQRVPDHLGLGCLHCRPAAPVQARAGRVRTPGGLSVDVQRRGCLTG